METWVIVVWSLVSITILGVFGFILYRRSNPAVKKPLGRENRSQRAVSVMRNFARSNSYHIIAPAEFQHGKVVARLDALVIGYFGILAVKSLGYNGEIYGSASDKEWVQINEGGMRNPFPNPITESAADVRAIREALLSAKLRQIPVEVVCVFTEPTAQLALPRSTGHYTLADLKSLVQKEKYQEDKGFDLEAIEKALKAGMVNNTDR